MPIYTDKPKQATSSSTAKSTSSSSSKKSSSSSSSLWTLDDHDFSFTDDDNINIACGLILGDAGCGKTCFITGYPDPNDETVILGGMPDPIALISYDYRSRHAVKKARKGGRRIGHVNIDIPSFKMSKEEMKIAARGTVEQTIKNLEWAARQAKEKKIRSIGFDGGTEFSGLLMTAYHGLLEEVDWDSVFGNDTKYIRRQWLRVFRVIRQSGAHFIMTARAQEIWKDKKPTDDFKFEGPKVMNEGVDFAAYLRTSPAMTGGLKREIKITKGGVNGAEEKKVYSEKEWKKEGGPFAYMCSRLYQTDYENWLE